ncbi:MAG: ribose-phosphate diphosphokinase [Candidatus Promineifilaceae bacterium]
METAQVTPSGFGQIKLFGGSGNPDLAQKISDALGIPLSPWEIIQFPNENLFIRLGSSVRGQDVYIIQSHCRPVHKNIMEMLIAIDAMHRGSAGRITVVMPYLAYSQSDKKDQPRVPITARLMADMIEAAGADRWVTIDLHADQIMGFYKIPGDALPIHYELVKELKKRDLSNAMIVSPDLGFAKKARNYASDLQIPLAFVEKRRIGNSGSKEALNIIGDVKGKNVFITDDIVDTGGSITKAVELVKKNGALDVSIVFTHAVLSDPATERLAAAPIKEIITTDTIPIPSHKMLPNTTIVTVANLLSEVIKRSHEGSSVGEFLGE